LVHNKPETHRTYFRDVWYPKNRESHIQTVTKYKNKLRQFLVDYKKCHPCYVCGEVDFRCLEFHHTEKKDFEISDIVHDGKGIPRVKRELEKCQVVCANCHRKIHWEKKGLGIGKRLR